MEPEKKEFENLVNILCRKVAHIIVESRLGRKIHTQCKVHADGSDWFNLSTDDMPEVVSEVKKLLATSSGISDPSQPVFHFCVEISLRTCDGEALVLEQWCLTLDRAGGTGARPSTNIINHLGILLKSLVVTTRLTTAYKVSRQQSQDSHIILYKLYLGEPNVQSLGDANERLVIGEVATPICSLSLALICRTKMALSSHSDPIVMKSDHFKPEISPRIRRVTAFVERRHSDSVDMVGVSSSSSSNMDTKTAGGSSTDSDQRRRVAAFADDLPDRPASGEVPFTRLVSEPASPSSDVSMSERSEPRPGGAASGAVTLVQTDPPPGSADDYVMVELRTPFSESESDGELSTFFRQCQTAPPLPSRPDRPGSASAPPGDHQQPQSLSFSQQLQTFVLQLHEFEEMVSELPRTDQADK